MITAAQLKLITPRAKVVELTAPLVDDMLIAAECTTVERAAMMLGQLAHESGEWRYHREVWVPTKVPNQLRYERDFSKPWTSTGDNRLAFRLGNAVAGDGYSFRGWGPLQVTGRANTLAASLHLYHDERLTRHTWLLDESVIGYDGAAWYWLTHQLNSYADKADLEGATKAINGGLNGLAQRKAYYLKALQVLKG